MQSLSKYIEQELFNIKKSNLSKCVTNLARYSLNDDVTTFSNHNIQMSSI